jgi:alkanesulfonate monooxygenase SsuD/methylene tetrahydromethanopterin reductase-like flavin-dependent oxidoreductase (luciferase family)
VEVGIGLPNAVPGTDGAALLDWARRADQERFSTLGTIGRLVYANYDDLIALAAAAAVTERIRLTTTVLLAPLHANAALLAKQTLSLQRLCGGRFVLGLALGARDDDYTGSGIEPTGRGALLDATLAELKRIWAGENRGHAGAIGPVPDAGPPQLVVGGHSPRSFRRVARFADGWIMGGGPPEQFAELGPQADAAWQAAGRPGKPRKLSLAYFALGPRAREQADWYIHDYYGWLGDQVAGQIAASVATDDEMVARSVRAFAEAGCDELIFTPCSGDPEQVARLAAAVT